ncbi:MAG TPA: MFS transporter [Fimbriimonadaceae bacterium]|nr:MFS transporter [Fimbriimonadaceae bacterium]
MATVAPDMPPAGEGVIPKATPLYRQGPVLRLILVAFLAELAYGVLNISTMPVYLKYDRSFGEGLIGLVFVAFLLSEAIFKGPMGHRADRYGPKLLMTVGPSISVVTSLLTLFVPRTGGTFGEVAAFLALRGLDGLGAAMLWPAAYAFVGETVNDVNRQRAMSALNLCYLVGIAFALPLGGAINDLTGTRAASMILACGLFACVALTVHFFIPSRSVSTEAAPSEGGLADLVRSLRTIPTYLLLAAATFIGIGLPMAIVKLFAYDQFNMSESAFGGLVLPAVLLMACLNGVMTRIGEQVGRARSVHIGMGLCTIGMSLIGLGAITTQLQKPWVLAVGAIPVGIGFLLTIPAWMASVSDIDPTRRGANIGAVMTAQGLGAIIGAPLGGLAYQKLPSVGVHLGLGPAFGRYSPFLGCAACLAFGWILSLRILHDGPRTPTS